MNYQRGSIKKVYQMEFNKNKLINKTIDKYAETWSHLLNTGDFIDQKYLKKIDSYIYKNMTKKFKEIEIFDLLYKEECGFNIGIFGKLRIWFSGLRPIYESERKKPIISAPKTTDNDSN